jgi:multidrug efflux pump subunit AcrA (membrane-fusion protein)
MEKPVHRNFKIPEHYLMQYVIIMIAMITLGGKHMDELKSAAGPAVMEPQLKKRKKKNKTVRIIVTIGIILIVLAGIAFGLYKLFYKDTANKEILRDIVQRGSIQSTVTGSGVTKAMDSASITLSSGGTVLEVFVKEGDLVHAGDPLYTIDSTEALAAVDEAQKVVDNYEKQLQAIADSYNYLSVTADYSGTLLDTADIKVGDDVAIGRKIATLVDDSKMKLVLYFNYAYEDAIHKGQTAVVSIPSTMSQLNGTVTEINYVRKITPEGAILFQAVISVDNPGTLTADIGATATLTSDSNETIYPYEAGKLAYNRTTDIVTKATGKAGVVNLLSYASVKAGALLLKLDAEDNEEQVAQIENQLKDAREKLQKAQENLNNFNAVSPLDGTVLFCALTPGVQVQTGTVAINIADTTVMTVEAQIDQLNITYVKPGMMCQITQWGRNGQEFFTGTIESVSLEGKFENGYSYYPAVIKVDNPEGKMMSGMYVDYNLVASQSDNCLMVPVQAVKYTESGACVFVETETKPENALDAELLGLPVPEGFYAVPVTVGLSDNTFAEIVDGVEEGTVVFTQYMTDNGNSYEMGGGGPIMIGKG